MKPLVRWTIGPVQKAGFDCLLRSIRAFTSLYEVDVVICHNCEPESLEPVLAQIPGAVLYDQRKHLSDPIKPLGVAWKLYPLRIDPSRHELSIDNDIIINERIPQINEFFESDSTLLLEETSRTYGRFEKHVPKGFCINSGVYGMPPKFSLNRYFNFYVRGEWELNAVGEHKASKTFDEQGLIALALLSHETYNIIPKSVITNCEWILSEGAGHHFIGLNRRAYHEPYQLYKSKTMRLYP